MAKFKVEFMSTEHPRWEEFYSRLCGPEGCDFHEGPNGPTGRCEGGNNRPYAVAILRSMGFSDASVLASLDHFSRRGGYCDCEILLNVDRRGVDSTW